MSIDFFILILLVIEIILFIYGIFTLKKYITINEADCCDIIPHKVKIDVEDVSVNEADYNDDDEFDDDIIEIDDYNDKYDLTGALIYGSKLTLYPDSGSCHEFKLEDGSSLIITIENEDEITVESLS